MKSFDFAKKSVHKTAENSPGYLLWKVSTLWRKAIEKVLKPLDLTHPQFVILASTAYLNQDQEKLSQASIAKHAGLDPNTTSQILKGLQNKGLIERPALKDERSKCPILTSQGKKVLSDALPAVEKADANFFKKVHLKQESALKALQKLAGF